MQIDITYIYTTVKKQAEENWKPTTALVGVAILVATIWGKRAFIGLSLIYIGGFAAFGPSIKVVTYLDLRGFLIVSALIGNGYFGIINPMLLNYYAAACMVAREWNFWHIYSNLSSGNEQLQQNTEAMRQDVQAMDAKIQELEKQFLGLLAEARAAVPKKEELVGYRSEAEAIQQRICYLIDLAKAVQSNTALQQRLGLVKSAEGELAQLQRDHLAEKAKFAGLMDELGNLNRHLATALETLQSQEKLKHDQITTLTGVIGNLQRFT